MQPHDDLLLQRLGGIVAQEIDLNIKPFASRAIGIADCSIDKMRAAQYTPMPDVILSSDVTNGLQVQSEEAEDPLAYFTILRDEAVRNKYMKIEKRYDLGIATCNLAVAFSESGILQRVALTRSNKKYGRIQPIESIWNEIEHQDSSVPHYRDYIAANAKYTADRTSECASAARSSLLVAVAAYAVHTSKIT